ncbi:hypothetical protein [Rhizobium ruizarguesonis]|uniref:hypothetical protein n=1 Tax=Rhizobium ruizarguesonis TaxID=2081791 RepID=UPI0013D89B82|nr:hypothetical protein [Rhizobium ruizarguesonis]NEH81309.1 hypothetical protein [Rhizobium ruizarguesonis]
MDSQLVVMGLFLQELDRPLEISSKEDRLRTQKAVYLGQLTGVDLGYRYSWYVHGPYSTSLTQDYYAFNALPDSEKAEFQRSSLNEATRTKLAKAKPLFTVPADVNLQMPQWLELLCSWHYLRKVAKYDDPKARQTMQAQKPHVAHYINQANAVLGAAGFMDVAVAA